MGEGAYAAPAEGARDHQVPPVGEGVWLPRHAARHT